LLIPNAVSSVSTSIRRDCSRARRAMSARGNALSCVSIAASTASTIAASSVIRMTWESGPCSACDSRSAATNCGFTPASAITSTSDGPAGMSIAAPPSAIATWRFASVT
jgi:hypothetical protein